MADRTSEGILLVLLEIASTMKGVGDALAAIYADDFDPEFADPEDPAVRKVLGWGEMLGTMTKNGLIAQELVLDLWWVAGAWGRVGEAALAEREKYGVTHAWENFEALAKAQGA